MRNIKLRGVQSATKLTAILITTLVTVFLFVFLWVLVFGFDALPMLSSSRSTAIDAPIGYDPLTAPEVNAVTTAALQAQGAKSLRATAPGGQEVLLVERHEASKAAYASGKWQRQGDVYVYDYATDTLIQTTVDVQSGAVITVERMQNVQLPLTEREEQRALALVQGDAALWAALADRYQAISGEPLQGLDQGLGQLQSKVSVFHGDVMPDRLNTAAQQCGRHRCAQVLLFTVDKTLLEIMPIVDLSQGQVVQTLGEE